ncbi:unnamed protein product, partial [Amoebophrya sp. A120]
GAFPIHECKCFLLRIKINLFNCSSCGCCSSQGSPVTFSRSPIRRPATSTSTQHLT